ncbi:hypothetical protein [Egbenema bharatensis]|uniref:hypothetical protein n=1 Tax=Egbenema bharatensis TaxID=3463334 RepID=UPI003A8BEEEE
MKRTRHLKIRRLGIYISVGLLTGVLLSCRGNGDPASDANSAQTDGSSMTGQNLVCNTPTHVAEVMWSDGEPQLTFASTNETVSSQVSPVAVLSNNDGSRTYGYRDDRAVFTRFYLDGTCFIQVLDGEDNVTVEAFGQTSVLESGEDTSQDVDTITPTENDSEPIAAVPSPEASPVVAPDAGNDELVATAPNPNGLSLNCSGVIQDEVDFTAYFNSDAGFSRVEFLPRTSEADEPLVSTLSYTGKNSAGQSLWRGSVSAMADVTLVHLSTAAAQPGDRISVGYDGRWGQAICQ